MTTPLTQAQEQAIRERLETGAPGLGRVSDADVKALLDEVARLRGENDTLLDERKAYQAANATFKHQGRDLRDALADRDRLAQRVSELEGQRDELADAVLDLDAENGRLRNALTAALPENMGGYPDLFWPSGFDGADPWGDWEAAAKQALSPTAGEAEVCVCVPGCQGVDGEPPCAVQCARCV